LRHWPCACGNKLFALHATDDDRLKATCSKCGNIYELITGNGLPPWAALEDKR
jgi:hypothetical protein